MITLTVRGNVTLTAKKAPSVFQFHITHARKPSHREIQDTLPLPSEQSPVWFGKKINELFVELQNTPHTKNKATLSTWSFQKSRVTSQEYRFIQHSIFLYPRLPLGRTQSSEAEHLFGKQKVPVSIPTRDSQSWKNLCVAIANQHRHYSAAR